MQRIRQTEAGMRISKRETMRGSLVTEQPTGAMLAVATLRTLDHKRTAFAQLRLGFEEELFLLEKFQIEKIAGRGFAL